MVIWALGQPAPQLPSNAGDLALVGLSIAFVGLSTGLRSERWRGLVLDQGGDLGRGESYGITVVGFMGNTVLPARGGDALRVVLARSRAELDLRRGVGTLIAERVLDVVMLVVIFTLLAVVFLPGVETPGGIPVGLIGAGVGIVLLIGVALAAGRRRLEWVERLIEFLTPMVAATRDLRGRHGAWMLVLTLAVWLAEAAVWMAAAASVGFDMTPIDALYLISFAAIFILIPAAPAYAGTLDSAVILGSRALGASGSLAVSFLVVLRFVLLIPLTLGGLVLVVFRYGGPAMLKAARESGREELDASR